MRPFTLLIRLWPFWVYAGFSWQGWHFQRTCGTVLAPTLYIGTEQQGKQSVLLIVFTVFFFSVAWRP